MPIPKSRAPLGDTRTRSKSVGRHLAVIDMARCQSGVVCRRQLLATGWTDDMIEAQLNSHRWFRLLPGVHATFTLPIGSAAPIAALWWAAHLFAGEESALGGHSALQAVGLGEPGPPVFVAVPWTQRATHVADWLVVSRHRLRARADRCG